MMTVDSVDYIKGMLIKWNLINDHFYLVYPN